MSRVTVMRHGLTLVAHAVPAALLVGFLGPMGGGLSALGLWAAVAFRLQRLALDRRRPAWVVRLLDEPMFCHWGAGLLSALTLPVAWALMFAVEHAGQVAVSAAWAAPALSYATGLFVSAWSIWGERRRIDVRCVAVPIPGLHPDLHGYRIAQVSDLHIGSYDDKERGLEWAGAVNALEADLTLVTGDLVTAGTHYYDDAADVLAALRAPDGVFVSLGNHDQWDSDRLARQLEERGLIVLRNASRLLQRGSGRLNIAGLDDWYARRDDLDATLASCEPTAPTVLMAHYPQFFDAAAARGVELVLSGHTHGGQIGIPGLAHRFNVMSLGSHYARGLHRRDKSTLYVNAGLGTTGPPMRLGVRPEITVFELAGFQKGA